MLNNSSAGGSSFPALNTNLLGGAQNLHSLLLAQRQQNTHEGTINNHQQQALSMNQNARAAADFAQQSALLQSMANQNQLQGQLFSPGNLSEGSSGGKDEPRRGKGGDSNSSHAVRHQAAEMRRRTRINQR